MKRASSSSSSSEVDLNMLPAGVRRVVGILRGVFGGFATVGALAVVVHAVVFFTAMHYGASTPVGEKRYGIRDHSERAYVTHAVQQWIVGLEVAMIAGLGVGVPGMLGLEAAARRMAKAGRKV